jgi:hypothetical protein
VAFLPQFRIGRVIGVPRQDGECRDDEHSLKRVVQVVLLNFEQAVAELGVVLRLDRQDVHHRVLFPVVEAIRHKYANRQLARLVR